MSENANILPSVENEQNEENQSLSLGDHEESFEEKEQNEQSGIPRTDTEFADFQIEDQHEHVEEIENEQEKFALGQDENIESAEETEELEVPLQAEVNYKELGPIGDEGHFNNLPINGKEVTDNLLPKVDRTTRPGKRIKNSEKLSLQSLRSDISGNEELDENIKSESESESTIYLESSYDVKRKDCASIRSTIPPKSWPSDANLSQDSDIYPQSSEYIVKRESDMVLKPTTTGKDLLRELSKMQIDSASSIKEKVETVKHVASPVLKFSSGQVQIEKKFEKSVENKKEISCEEQEIESEVSQKGFTFLRNILMLPLCLSKLEEISFSETLLISYDLNDENQKAGGCECKSFGAHKSLLFEPRDIQEMGGMCLNIETAACKLITFCTTQFSCLGTAGASRLLSVVDNSFALIDEKKTEWHCSHDEKMEKSLEVSQEGTRYVAFRTESKDNKVFRHRGEINLKGDLLLDGGLFALMRYLVIINFIGEFETWSVHVTGDICRCKFTVGKKKLMFINGSNYMTIRIKKELFRLNRYPEVSKTYFLPTGHMVRHRWKGCRYFIHINPLGNIPPTSVHTNLENQWMSDIMLISKYLDEKQKRNSEIQTYFGDNVEIKSIMQDFMLCLLQLKPENILEFTIDYFTNLFRE